jgi:beta-phosphoglucomutase family hydrolase
MNKNSLKAVLWDMDGVIADTAALHCKSWQIAFANRGVVFTEEDFKHHFGQRNDAIIRSRLGTDISDADIEAIAWDKEESFREDAKGKLAPFEGVVDLLKIIRVHGFLCAVASSAPLENVQLILKELGIESCFQAVVYGKEVSEGKPSPLVFLKAAQKLGVLPQNCIVIEDATAGVKAARAAGMHCIAVTNTHPTGKLIEADMVVVSLALVGSDDLNKLFGIRG